MHRRTNTETSELHPMDVAPGEYVKAALSQPTDLAGLRASLRQRQQ